MSGKQQDDQVTEEQTGEVEQEAVQGALRTGEERMSAGDSRMSAGDSRLSAGDSR